MQHPSDLDLDRTDDCPLGVRCEIDGAERPDLVVATYDSPMGTFCLTICPDHAAPEAAPAAISLATANRLVVQHCMHLGITVDAMDEALDR